MCCCDSDPVAMETIPRTYNRDRDWPGFGIVLHDWLKRLSWKGGGTCINQSKDIIENIKKSQHKQLKAIDQSGDFIQRDIQMTQSEDRIMRLRTMVILSPVTLPVQSSVDMNGLYKCINTRSVFSVFYKLSFLLLCLCVCTSAQDCSPVTDCHPPSEDLINTTNSLRMLEVSSTCGSNGLTTTYKKNSLTLDQTLFYCNSTNQHPKTDMIDRNNGRILNFVYENAELGTYWQSDNAISSSGVVSEQFILANFSDPFLLRYIRVIFISPHIVSPSSTSDMRPRALVIEKKNTSVSDWEPLRYFAESCASDFPGVPEQKLDGSGPDYSADVVVCMQRYYAGDSATFTGWGFGRQEVKFSPSREFDQEFAKSYRLQSHYSASALRLRFIKPADTVALSSYYAIADFEIDGQCSCFGHAASCSGPNQAECNCQHETTGQNCDQCKPLYNNKPWRIGADSLANACEDCGCNGHADSCHYDSVQGYGVCDDCREQTTADKCDECVSFYYVNPEKDLYNVTNPAPSDCVGFNGTVSETYYCGRWCIPCNCSQEGSVSLSLYNCNNASGQCECKQSVEGRTCDVCKNGYWNLTESNPSGCVECKCSQLGTLNNSNLCDKVTGECICKANTEGRDCDRCKPEYHALSFSDPDGCTACACDPGASLSPVCPADTGVCPCRPNIGGQMCTDPFVGYFGPDLDFLTYEAEFSTDAGGFSVEEQPGHGDLSGTVTGLGYLVLPAQANVRFTVTVPRTVKYNVVLRYKSPVTFSGVQMSVQMADPAGTGLVQYECGGQTYSVNQDFTDTINLGPAASTDGIIVSSQAPLCLKDNIPYNVSIKVGISVPANQDLRLDSLVVLPLLTDLSTYVNATTEAQQQILQCYDASLGVQNELRANLSCHNTGYSLMTELFQGAKACSCDGVGSRSGICEGVGGQCPCHPGVMLLDCSMCKVNHYGFSSGVGCTACDCHTQGSLVLSCNDTGICTCRNNVQGIKCDSCIPEHHGLQTGQGCVPCVCNMDHSLNNSCMDDGQCHCKPGVGGLSCDQCLDGYYNLTFDGCTSCDCDVDGSTAAACIKQTGVCTCKTRVSGEKCDTCQNDFFGLGQWNPNGCLECFCSGHTKNCSTAPMWYYAVIEDSWNLLLGDSAIEGRWGGVDDQGQPIVVTAPTKITGTTAELVMRIENTAVNGSHSNLYFLATEQYLGDKRGSYGQNISVTLAMSIPPRSDPNASIEPTDGSLGDVILEGAWTQYNLVVALPEMPTETKTPYMFELKENFWHKDIISGPNPSYVEMLEVLAALKAIKVRANYVNVTGTITDLHSAVLYYSAPQAATREQIISNVEQCTCPPQYTGQFCEQCATGYRRSEPGRGPYSQCVLCDCNKHEQPGAPCDPETGLCNCAHNTQGDSCQLCQDGYYGDATLGSATDCQPCLCPGDIPAGDVNTFASVCEADAAAQDGFRCVNCTSGHGGDHCDRCVDQWYGEPQNQQNNNGRCVPCVCNGRADTCNSTSGECIGCRNDTAGQQCDICAPGFFGIAASYSCQPCTCGLLGATGDCDHRNGDCICKPNVVTSNPTNRTGQCDVCNLYTFNYTSGAGCEPCACHDVGAQNVDCDRVTGQCECRKQVTGRQCDACNDTYWQITYDGCTPCECMTAGTINIPSQTFGTCDLTSGQCQCASAGIIGRTCDQCARGTTGVYPQCQLCGECYDNWAKKIDDLGVEMSKQYNTALTIWNTFENKTYAEVNPVLSQIAGNLSAVESSISVAVSLIGDITYLRENFERVRVDSDNLTNRLGNLSQYADSIQQELTQNQRYSGTVQVNASYVANPDSMLAYANSSYTHITELDATANATWKTITDQTTLIQQSNGNIDIFLTTVTTAMGVLAQAKATRQAAEIITGGSFPLEYADNTQKLGILQTAVNSYPGQIASIRAQLDDAGRITSQTNQTVLSATSVIRQRKAEMADKVLQAERIKFNSTQAQTSSLEAKTAVNSYKNLANLTKLEMSRALEDVVQALQSLTAINNAIALGNEMQANTSAIQLRPLQEMLDITTQIESTDVSATDVENTLRSAENGLQVAADAKNVTELAVAESTKALELIEGIQYNLQQSESLRNSTQANLNQLQEYNSSIATVVKEVTTKAASARVLQAQTTYNINSVLMYVSTVSQCFDQQGAALGSMLSTLREANNTAEIAGQQASLNRNRVADLTTPVNNKMTELQAQYSQVIEVRSEVNTLTSDLNEVTSIVDLQQLQNEFHLQRLEMNNLETQLSSLEGQLDALLATLDLLQPDATNCNRA